MIKILYDQFVKKHPLVCYEYERYVRENTVEHYSNRLKQWRLLFHLNVHYRIKKSKSPLIYFDAPKSMDNNTNILLSHELPHNEFDGPIKNSSQAEMLYINPGLSLYKAILEDKSEDYVLFLCPYAGTGDVYLSGMYIKSFAQKNNIINYIVLVIGEGNRKVISLFDFENIVKITQQEADCLIRLAMFLDDDKHIVIIHHDAPQVYFGILENFRNINDLNFTDLFVNVVFGHSPESGKQLPCFRFDHERISAIFSKYDLQPGKTVVLSPYAKTLYLLPEWVWVKIASLLSSKGYTVVTNVGGEFEKPVEGTRAVYFDYDISVPFLEKCGYFIGIRSGLCDVISSARCKKIIIYQPYLFWGEATAFEYFSLNSIGFCDDAIELQYDGIEFLELIKRVVFAVEYQEIEDARPSVVRYKKSIETVVVITPFDNTLLGQLVENKPQPLIPINDKAILFHLFERFPGKRFIIIDNHPTDILNDYISAFANVDFKIIEAKDPDSSCSGIQQALEELDEHEPFVLVSSDMVLPDGFSIDSLPISNYITTSDECISHWQYMNDHFSKDCSGKNNVMNLFVFEDKTVLKDIPTQGDFIEWLSECNSICFTPLKLKDCRICKLQEDYKYTSDQHIETKIYKGTVTKKALDLSGEKLLEKEKEWYRFASDKKLTSIPYIFSYEPFVMEKIEGKKLSAVTDMSFKERLSVLRSVVSALKAIHSVDMIQSRDQNYMIGSVDQTFHFLKTVQNIIPFAKDPVININGRECKNIFYYQKEFEELIRKYVAEKLVFSHGNCLLSNIFLTDNKEVMLIDPVISETSGSLFNDEAYDWAILYSSLAGNFDQFRLGNYSLHMTGEKITVNISSSGWEDLETEFFRLIGKRYTCKQLKLLNSLIWFQESAASQGDYDSLCSAFYMGLYYMEDVLV